jgi:hypothetical protein
MFEQTFKNIDDILHKDAGCGSELDYVEQTSWILFLKYLDDLEKDKETAARFFNSEKISPILYSMVLALSALPLNFLRYGNSLLLTKSTRSSPVKVVSPKIGNSIYDGAVGSAGFLVEAFDYLNQPNLSTNQILLLQKNTILLHFGSFLATKRGICQNNIIAVFFLYVG